MFQCFFLFWVWLSQSILIYRSYQSRNVFWNFEIFCLFFSFWFDFCIFNENRCCSALLGQLGTLDHCNALHFVGQLPECLSAYFEWSIAYLRRLIVPICLKFFDVYTFILLSDPKKNYACKIGQSGYFQFFSEKSSIIQINRLCIFFSKAQ